jgi:hypothetical protein
MIHITKHRLVVLGDALTNVRAAKPSIYIEAM